MTLAGLLDEEDPFEIDSQAVHFKHPHVGIDDIDDVWASDPLFSPAKPPAHWLMVAEVSGPVLTNGAAGCGARRRPSSVPPDRLLRGFAGTRHPVQEGPQMNESADDTR